MRKVITYGTFDLLHEGHINLLKRAKALGDYLVVGVTSDAFDRERGKLNVRDNTLARIDAVRKTGFADEIIIEEYVGQKIDDIQRMEVDVFAIGSDWEGKFDYLKEFCEVKYLPRTEGISSTMLRSMDSRTLKLGIVGTGRIARRFIPEISYVSGLKATVVFNPHLEECCRFAKEFDIWPAQNFSQLLENVDAVYIASPHLSHYHYTKEALLADKHVMCEIPMTLSVSEAKELYTIAKKKKLVLLEASKTAHSPAFNHIVSLAKSGVIGDVVDIRASLSKLTGGNVRELDSLQAGGCMTELSHFPLLSIVKLLGTGYSDLNFHSKTRNGVDVFTKGVINYPSAVSTITLGLGVKTEGNLVVSGTKGYIYVPAPWWRTDFFEIRYENQTLNKKYFYPYEGEGLRYEIQEFVSMIFNQRYSTYRLRENEALCIIRIIEYYREGNYTILK